MQSREHVFVSLVKLRKAPGDRSVVENQVNLEYVGVDVVKHLRMELNLVVLLYVPKRDLDWRPNWLKQVLWLAFRADVIRAGRALIRPQIAMQLRADQHSVQLRMTGELPKDHADLL